MHGAVRFSGAGLPHNTPAFKFVGEGPELQEAPGSCSRTVSATLIEDGIRNVEVLHRYYRHDPPRFLDFFGADVGEPKMMDLTLLPERRKAT